MPDTMTIIMFCVTAFCAGFLIGRITGMKRGIDIATEIGLKKMKEQHEWTLEQIRNLNK